MLTEMPQASSCARDHCCCSTGGDSPRSQMWYPLLASTLLVVDEEFFHKNAWAFLRTVYKLFKVSVASSRKGTLRVSRNARTISTVLSNAQDKSTKPVALEAIKYILDAYCSKFASRDSELTTRLTEVTQNVFPNAKVCATTTTTTTTIHND